jgi:hypothetical protein
MHLLALAALLAVSAELAHGVLACIAIGGIYPLAVVRFALIAAVAITAVLARTQWAHWILIAFASWWAIDHGAQATAQHNLTLALVAIALAASAILTFLASRSAPR